MRRVLIPLFLLLCGGVAGGAFVAFHGSGSDTKSVVIPSSTSWTNVTLSGVTITAGQAEVGINSTTGTTKADDFTLVAE